MPACQLEEYHDEPGRREELIQWLVATDTHGLDHALWHRRLAHWWDENPFSTLCPERGWLLRHAGKIVGFMAVIPACYAMAGRPTPAYMASTWRVDEPHRNASLPLFMKLRRLGQQHVLVDTTPTPEVQQLLLRAGWVAVRGVTKHFLLRGLPGRWLHGGRLPSLPAGLRITRHAGEVRSLAAGCRRGAGLEKWLTPEALRWFAASPMRRHEFVGVVDAAGQLTSHLMLTPTRVRGVPAWLAVEHFTTHASPAELHALVAAVVSGGLLPGHRPVLSLAAFPGDDTWDALHPLHSREEQVCHHFSFPPALAALPKHTVLAEGDWGL